jgi:hypothetical protein
VPGQHSKHTPALLALAEGGKGSCNSLLRAGRLGPLPSRQGFRQSPLRPTSAMARNLAASGIATGGKAESCCSLCGQPEECRGPH